jgi:hypothetical protein
MAEQRMGFQTDWVSLQGFIALMCLSNVPHLSMRSSIIAEHGYRCYEEYTNNAHRSYYGETEIGVVRCSTRSSDESTQRQAGFVAW